jgi:serine/threonine protein kinase/Tfp pilus assembly protein PilF
LQQFLAGSLPAAQSRAVEAHLNACASCCALLDRWTEDPAIVAGARAGDDKSPRALSPGLAEVLKRLKGERASIAPGDMHEGAEGARHVVTRDCPHGVSEETTVPLEDKNIGAVALDFLAQSDRPGSLGRLGPYEVLERIGQGGMGIVLKAHDARLNRLVAVKVLMPALAANPLARRRFTREAQAAAAVCHENVVTIHAVEEAAGLPFLVMQLVVGQSLQQRLNRDGPLGRKETLRIGMQIASGLAAAHAQGLVHRDIKPANILLENGVARVKITDFGLARAVDDASLSTSGTIAGTPYYMSPEQARGEPIDRRTDLFSLGSVLYAMCTGQPPFRGSSTVAVLRKVSDEPPRSIGELNCEVPDWLEAIITKLMAKNPAERFQTASDVADVLAQRLAELQEPRPQPTASVSGPTKSRRLGEVVAVLLSLAALAIGLTTWWAVKSRDAARDAADPGASLPGKPSPPDPPPATATAPAVATATRDPALAKFLCEQAADALKRFDFARALEGFTEAVRRDPESAMALVGRAKVYISNPYMNWPGAIADTTDAIRLDPNNAEAYEVRACAEQRSGVFRRAIDDATEAIRLDAKLKNAYLHRGAAYNGLSEWNHAIVDFDELIRRAPESAWGWFSRANAYSGLGNQERALKDVDQAIKLSSINHFWYLRSQIHIRMSDYDRAVADITEGIRICPNDTERSNAYRSRADVEASQSKIEPAIADYTEAIRLRGGKGQAEVANLRALRANLYMAHGENDRAIADYDEAISLKANTAAVYYCRALARLRKGLCEQATADFEAGTEAAGADKFWAGACLVGRGDAAAIAGRVEQAEIAFEKALAFDRGRLNHVLTSRAWFIDRPRGDYGAALKKLEEPAKTGMILPFLYRGLLYARTGAADRALADFAEVIKRVKPRPDWFSVADYYPRWLAFLVGRGEAHLLKGDLDRALADSDEAVRFAPHSSEARLLRARVHATRGKDDLAAADRREAARLTPDPMLALPEHRPAVSPSSR